MSKIIIPANYTPALNLYDTQRAIGTVKRLFADTSALRSTCTACPHRCFWRLPPA